MTLIELTSDSDRTNKVVVNFDNMIWFRRSTYTARPCTTIVFNDDSRYDVVETVPEILTRIKDANI